MLDGLAEVIFNAGHQLHTDVVYTYSVLNTWFF